MFEIFSISCLRCFMSSGLWWPAEKNTIRSTICSLKIIFFHRKYFLYYQIKSQTQFLLMPDQNFLIFWFFPLLWTIRCFMATFWFKAGCNGNLGIHKISSACKIWKRHFVCFIMLWICAGPWQKVAKEKFLSFFPLQQLAVAAFAEAETILN